MGRGRRYVGCCDSAVWCQAVYWVQGIWGAITILASALFIYAVMSYFSYYKSQTGQADSQLVVAEIIVIAILGLSILVGVAYIGLAILLFCGLQKKSNKMMKNWVVGSIVLLVLDACGGFGFVGTSSSVKTGSDIISFLIVILKIGGSIFAIWIVDAHRREMFNLVGLGQNPYQYQYPGGPVPIMNGPSQYVLQPVPIPDTGVVQVENPPAFAGTAQNA